MDKASLPLRLNPNRGRGRRSATVLLLALLSMLVCCRRGDAQEQQSQTSDCPNASRPTYQFPFLRFDEDWSFLRCAPRADRWDRIKYIPLHLHDGYLSLGGDIREVYESYDQQYWGDGPQGAAGWLVHHYLLHADAHLDKSFRVFGELQAAFENGRNGGPRPYDENKLDLHQAFVDFTIPSTRRRLTLRLGRQELYYGSGRLVDARFGLNTRISVDGAKSIAQLGRTHLEVFASRPTLQKPGIFDDSPDSKKIFWGAYSTTKLNHSRVVDLYYLGFRAASQTFAVGTGPYQLHMIGARVAGSRHHFDFDQEANVQLGTFRDGDVRAWSIASLNGYAFGTTKGSPRISLRSDVTSGDSNPNDHHLGSFFPLYARGKYFGEADLNGPVNTIDLIPQLDLHPTKQFLVSGSYGVFWRQSTSDGVYGFAGNLYKTGDLSRARLIGQQAEVEFNFFVAPHTLLRTVYQHFFSGAYLKQTPLGRNVNYVTVWMDYHF